MESIFAFIIGAGVVVISYAIGYYYGHKQASLQIINELTDLVLENIIDLKHEVVGEQHYLYYADNGEFAAQGTTLDEAARNFSARDKSVGRVATSLGKPVFIVDGKIETE